MSWPKDRNLNSQSKMPHFLYITLTSNLNITKTFWQQIFKKKHFCPACEVHVAPVVYWRQGEAGRSPGSSHNLKKIFKLFQRTVVKRIKHLNRINFLDLKHQIDQMLLSPRQLYCLQQYIDKQYNNHAKMASYLDLFYC